MGTHPKEIVSCSWAVRRGSSTGWPALSHFCKQPPIQTQPRGSQALVMLMLRWAVSTRGQAAPLGSLMAIAAHPNQVSAHRVTKAVSQLAFLLSKHIPEALPHRPKLGGKEGPAQKEASSSALCTNYSSTLAGFHCLPMQDQRCSHLSEFLLEISPGIYCRLQPGPGCGGAPWLTPRVKHNLQAHSMEQGTGRELSRKYFAENKTFKAFQQQSTENRTQTPREEEWEKVRSGWERERGRDQTINNNPGENGGAEVAKDFLSPFPAGAGDEEGQFIAVWPEQRALQETLRAHSKHSHSLPAAASFKTGSVARALIYLLIAVLLLLWKMFSHRFNSSHSTLLHPDHLWSQTPQSDRAWQLFWYFYYNSTFRSANLLIVSIKEPCTATRKLPLAQSGSVILWDFALSL